MQRTYRIVPATTTATAPRACRAPCSRNMFTASPFYPLQQQQAFNPVAELAPLFRVLDSAVSELAGGPNHAERAARRHRQLFTPRFDVREVGSAYELKGEVPGVEQKDLQIEFVDEKTLVVRGSSVHEHESSNKDQTTATTTAAAATPAAEAVEGSKDNTTTTTTTADDTASEKSASYHKASVEDDEDDFVDAGAEAEAEGEKSDVVKGKAPSTAAAAEADPATSVPDTNINTHDSNQQQSSQQQSKYWVSERSTGSFERRFVFPGRVDQEAVRASLKNGILSVVVPKLAVQEARRIEIL